jgi:predicted nucleic acid-binding protein
MAATVLVDTSFLVALLNRIDPYHEWASGLLKRCAPPWRTCDAVLSETFHITGSPGKPLLIDFVRDGGIMVTGAGGLGMIEVLTLMEKYADVPMSFADACLVRMTEMLPDPTLLTTDSDFRIYRRHGRKVVPCIMPA